ncbi:unnamed protein product [Heligmosomoides polygyrus]|uniref:Retrotrans_gag domain-containing protein n=1 Tax=Heligmosomoides polygyrus TaxID=6339 RepID=A0A183G1N6_HELPZ|nr:unnamed protein product [Heligmosomoides polygyrus]
MSDDMEREIGRIIEENEQEQSRMAKLQQELAQLRQQVQAMAQQNALMVKLATTAMTAHMSKLLNCQSKWQMRLGRVKHRRQKGQYSEAALKVERTVTDMNKKHHEELSAVFDQAIRDDMSMRALSKLLDVESTRVVDTAQSTTEPQPVDSTTHMEANAQEEQFRSAFRLLNTGDLDMEAPLPPVTFDAVRAANDRRLHGRIATMSALGEQGQRPKCHLEGKGFTKFVTSFTMKYGRIGLADDMLIHLMSEKLKGYPRAVMKTLPNEIRHGGFADFVAALKAKFAENSSAKRMEAHMELKQLRMTGSVSEYCAQLESLTRAANPDATETDLSMEAYGKLKNLGKGIERNKKVATAVRSVAEPKRSQVSIFPLDTVITPSKSGFDLDADVEEIELDRRTHIYDASRHRMLFKGAVRLTLTPKDGPEERVVFLVKKDADDTIVLGTNILDKFGIQASPTA